MDDKFESNMLKPIDSRLWEDRIMAPDMNIARYKEKYGVRLFTIAAEQIRHNILADVTIDALGYNGSTPGPIIIVKEGEWLFLTLENRLDVPTSLMLHGLNKPRFLQGFLDLTLQEPLIMPGENYTYKLLCTTPGTYFYHSTEDFQVALGLIGALIILPSDKNIVREIVPDQDYILLMQNWQLTGLELGHVIPGNYVPDKFHRKPNFFTINGKCFPDTSPLYFKYGKRVRIRLLTKSGELFSVHIHGHTFDLVSVNGFPRLDIHDDTIELNSGRRTDIELNADNAGVWRINSTDIFHQSNNGVFPGGITTRIVYV
ncbi:MAG: hypothetical protein K0S61_3731 [Anaerocolumna sp.]|nr:hypothetical protein [Anaerocolumna sp.]